MYGAWLPPRDDHLSPALDGTDQEIGLALRNERVILAPDGQDRDLDSWQRLFVLEEADGCHGHEPGDSLGMLGRQRQGIDPLIDGETMTGRSICSRSSTFLSQPRARPCDGAAGQNPAGRGRKRDIRRRPVPLIVPIFFQVSEVNDAPVQQHDGLPGLPALDEVMDLGPLHIKPARDSSVIMGVSPAARSRFEAVKLDPSQIDGPPFLCVL